MDEEQRRRTDRLLSGMKSPSGALNWTRAVWAACEAERGRLSHKLDKTDQSSVVFRALLKTTQLLVLWAGLTVRLFDELAGSRSDLYKTAWANEVMDAMTAVQLNAKDSETLGNAWQKGTLFSAQQALEVVTQHARTLKARCIALWDSMPQDEWTQEAVQRTSLYDPSLTEEELAALKRINELLVQYYNASKSAYSVLGGPVFSLDQLQQRFGSYFDERNGKPFEGDARYNYDQRDRLIEWADPGNSSLGLALVLWKAFGDKTPSPPKGGWTAESVSSRVLYPPYYSKQETDMLIRINQQRATPPPPKRGSPVKFVPQPPLLSIKELQDAYETFFKTRYEYAGDSFMQWAEDPRGLTAYLACTKTKRINDCVQAHDPRTNVLAAPSTRKPQPRPK